MFESIMFLFVDASFFLFIGVVALKQIILQQNSEKGRVGYNGCT